MLSFIIKKIPLRWFFGGLDKSDKMSLNFFTSHSYIFHFSSNVFKCTEFRIVTYNILYIVPSPYFQMCNQSSEFFKTNYTLEPF